MVSRSRVVNAYGLTNHTAFGFLGLAQIDINPVCLLRVVSAVEGLHGIWLASIMSAMQRQADLHCVLHTIAGT